MDRDYEGKGDVLHIQPEPVGCNYSRRNQVRRFNRFFFTQKIGEYAYGFTAGSEEEVNGDSLTVFGSTIVADAADFLKAFPQYTLNDYLYNLSCAQIQFMSIDNTHTKYLHGSDKKAWEEYKKALEANKKLDNFAIGLRKKMPKLGKGEVFEIPVPKKQN